MSVDDLLAFIRRRPTRKERRRAVMDACGGRCVACGSVHRLQQHHVAPQVNGGPDLVENLVMLCHPCHTELHRAPGRMSELGRQIHNAVQEFQRRRAAP